MPIEKRLRSFPSTKTKSGRPRRFKDDLAYALGAKKPRYPLPSTIGEVDLGRYYPGIVYINRADGEDWVYAYDTWNQEQLT